MDIIQMTRELCKTLQADERYIKSQLAEKATEEDAELQKMIGDFNLKKIDITNEVNKEEKDSEKINKLNTELQELYGKVMTNPAMVAFVTAKDEVNKLLADISQIITRCANGEDPDTVEVVHEEGCSGSCASCSSHCND